MIYGELSPSSQLGVAAELIRVKGKIAVSPRVKG